MTGPGRIRLDAATQLLAFGGCPLQGTCSARHLRQAIGLSHGSSVQHRTVRLHASLGLLPAGVPRRPLALRRIGAPLVAVTRGSCDRRGPARGRDTRLLRPTRPRSWSRHETRPRSWPREEALATDGPARGLDRKLLRPTMSRSWLRQEAPASDEALATDGSALRCRRDSHSTGPLALRIVAISYKSFWTCLKGNIVAVWARRGFAARGGITRARQRERGESAGEAR
jgi:hypothetical protein